MSFTRRAAVAALIAFALTACSSSDGSRPPARARSDGVVVASFDFAESELLAEIYATSLESHGIPVTRRLNLGSRELLEPALVQHKIDFLPEYLGTALSFLTLGAVDVTSDAELMHGDLTRTLEAKGVETLDYARAQNQNGIVVTTETATRYGLQSISDLRGTASDLVFGGPAECDERPLCLPGLKETYGLEFKSFQPLDVGGPATLAALKGGEIDVGLLFTTDPNIQSPDLVLLADDKNLQPADNVVPVAGAEVVEQYGDEFDDAVDSVTKVLTTAKLRTLNHLIQLENRNLHETAVEFLTAEGLL
jgi:osmoprotectant transport system substrate-binding protein